MPASMPLPVLLSSQAGSPADPRAWSGTPYRIFIALQAEGRLSPQPWSSAAVSRLALRADAALGLGHGFIPGPARRWSAARRASAEAVRLGCTAQLHLGTYDAPLSHGPRPFYLYVDSSYDFWERHALSAASLGAWRRRAYRALDRRSVLAARHIFTAGRHVADSFVRHLGVPADRITAVGTGLGDIRPYFGAKDYRRNRLLIVARNRPRDKGLPLLLAAFERARERLPDLTLTVIGGAKYPELKDRPGINPTGWISAEELQRHFDESCLYVMPAGYEPWGLSYLEALCCRTPIIGFDRGAFPEISGDGRYGFTLRDADATALATLIVEALADPQRLERMGGDGQRACLQHYRWERVVARIADRITRDQHRPQDGARHAP